MKKLIKKIRIWLIELEIEKLNKKKTEYVLMLQTIPYRKLELRKKLVTLVGYP